LMSHDAATKQAELTARAQGTVKAPVEERPVYRPAICASGRRALPS
jgi:hypothetical protein